MSESGVIPRPEEREPHVCKCHCAEITELQVAVARLIGDLGALRLNVEATMPP